jgi:hypothetical protein
MKNNSFLSATKPLKETIASPSSALFSAENNNQSSSSKKVMDDHLIDGMRKQMKLSLKTQCFGNAIFFADKLVDLCYSKGAKYIQAIYDLGKQTNSKASVTSTTRSILDVSNF